MWLLYFDYNYHRTLSRKPWQIFLSRTSIDENWFLINRQRLGSAKFIIKWIIIPIVILRVISYFTIRFGFDIASESIDAGTLCFFAVFSFIFIGIVWSKYPDYHDIYFIRSELKWLCLSTLVLALSYLTWGILMALQIEQRIDSDIGFIQILFTELMCCFIMFIMIRYPLWKSAQNSIRKIKAEQIQIVRSQSDSTSTTFETSDSMEEVIAMTTTAMVLDWETEIETIEGYERFAGFLSKEFAIENLLFVTEVRFPSICTLR